MLENCPDISACETTLSESTKNVEYLGEVDFFLSDIDKLSMLLKDMVRKAENRLDVFRKFPACLSFYLVGRGITSYDSGDYWTLVSQELGVSDSITQNKMGAVFIKFLWEKELFHSRIRRAPSYVSRILLHGGIPHSCLQKFYAEVVKYLLEQRLIHEDDIRGELCRLREQEKEREEYEELRLRCQSLWQEVESLENIIRLNRRREELTNQTPGRDTWADLPDYDSFLVSMHQDQLVLAGIIEKLQQRKAECLEVIRSFTREDRRFLDLGPVIEDLAGTLEEYQYALHHIPTTIAEMGECERRLYDSVSIPVILGKSDQFARDLLWTLEREFLASILKVKKTRGVLSACPEIGELVALAKERPKMVGLVAAAETWSQRLIRLKDLAQKCQQHEQSFAAVRSSVSKWEGAWQRFTDSLPLLPTGVPEEVLGQLSERAVQAASMESLALQARDTFEREIAPALSDARARAGQIGGAIASARQWLRDLGGGDFEAGIRRLGDKHRALLRLKEIEEELGRLKDGGLSFGLDEGLAWEERLRQELHYIRKYLNLKRKQIELAAVAAETKRWADLPDFAQFMAESLGELDRIEREVQELRAKETKYSLQIDSFTSADRGILELTDSIDRMTRDLDFYIADRKKKDVLVAQVTGCMETIEDLAAQLWPGGWEEGYTPAIRGLDISAIDTAWNRFIEDRKAYRQVERLLANTNVVPVRPGKEFWLGVLLSFSGAGVALAIVGGVGYPVTILGLALLARGCFRLSRARREKIKKKQSREDLAKELLRVEALLADSRQELAQLLVGLPVSWESVSATGEEWPELLACLQGACQKRNSYQEELVRLERVLGEWETALHEVAASLPEPVTETPEALVRELVQRTDQARRRRVEASEAGRAMETEIFPTLCRLQNRRAKIESSIAAVEQKLRNLGGGDLVAGQLELGKRKAALARLRELEDQIGGIKDLMPLVEWNDAVLVEERLMTRLENLQGYLSLKGEQQKVLAIVGDSVEWEEFADYDSFVDSRESTLAELAQRISRLEKEKANYLEIAEQFTSQDQLLIANATAVANLQRDLGPYKEWKQQRDSLLLQIDQCQKEICSLVDQLWSGGWESSYLGSSGWFLVGFVNQLACFGPLEDLLGQFVDSLKTMETAHGQYRRCVDQLGCFHQRVTDWNGKWQLVSAKVPSPVMGDLSERLSRARTRAQEAAVARDDFRAQVWPRLVEAESRKTAIDNQINEIELKFRELGGGDRQEGIRLVQRKKQSLAELADIEEELASCAAGLSCPLDHWDGALSLREQKAAQLARDRITLEQIERRISAYHSFLDSADEPAQRFVLYGGDWVIKWLHACVALHRHYLREKIDLKPVIAALPARVLQELDTLVRSAIGEDNPSGRRAPQSTREISPKKKPDDEGGSEKRKNTSEEFPPPELLLDVERSELKLLVGGYRFPIYDPSAPPEIYVSIAGEGTTLPWKKEIRLRGYLRDGMVEVRAEPCSLPVFAAGYLVTVHTGGIERSRRYVEAFGDLPYLTFTEEGKRIEANNVAQQRVWLVYPADFAVNPVTAVLSEDRVSIAGRDLQLALIDFRRDPGIYLTGEGDDIYEIRVSPGVVSTGPYLSEEETVPGAWTQDRRPIYIGDVPRLLVPLEDAQDIEAWSILVEGIWSNGAFEKLVQGQEVADLAVEDDGRLAIFLDEDRLLGRRPVGEYTVYLRHEDYGRHRFDLTIFPDLMLSFNQLLYFPRREDGARVRLNVIIPEHLTEILQVRVKKPAGLVGRDGDEVHIGIDAGYDSIDLELGYAVGGRSCQTSVTVEIPKVRWRLRTKDDGILEQWNDNFTEVWHEDCFGMDNPRLEVTVSGHLPKPVEGARLFLDGTGHQLRGRINEGIWKFDLAGLADSLHGGEDVYTLSLVLEDDRGKNMRDGQGRLLAIRSHWRVADFHYAVEESLEGWTLRASWTDRGRQTNRVARLWRMDEPWQGPLEVGVADGSSCLELLRNRTELPAGSYLLTFAVKDPWGGQVPAEFPRVTTDCEQIEIYGTGTQVIFDECRWKDEDSLLISGAVVNAGGPVEITIGLLGVVKGTSRDCWEKASTDENGRFSLLVRNPLDRSRLRTDGMTKPARPHWLGAMVDRKEPVYHFELLPDPGGVWWPLGSPSALAGEEAFGGGRLFINCLEATLDQPILNGQLSEEYLESLHQGHNSFSLPLNIAGKSKNVKLFVTSGSNEARLELETGAIKCTTCQKIEPDQASWRENHSTIPPICKGFIFDVRKMTARLYWYWDTTSLLANMTEKYARAGRRPLTLFDNLAAPVPDSVWGDQRKPALWFDREKLVAALWEREVILLSAAGR